MRIPDLDDFCNKNNGVCEEYKEFERNRPRTPRNTWNARGKLKDIFHKKGRVITNGNK